MNALLDWLTLYLTPGLGPGGCKRLVDYFGGPRQVLEADFQDINRVAGLKKAAKKALSQSSAYREAEKEIQKAHREGIAIITWDDQAYPELLRNIHNPPVLLYVKGDPTLLGYAGLGIVGARAATSYGLKIAEDFAFLLAERGLTVFSGLALGIDTAAHQGALKAKGKTVAVLGNGLDIVYPSQNIKLFDKIAAKGALVSEYPLGTKPDGFRFPARNRIISGLSLGVLVTEAAQRSGSLITANLALEQGREVFAVPGRIDSAKSAGAHRLVQEGAKLVHTVGDILEELQLDEERPAGESYIQKENRSVFNLTPEAAKIFSFLDVYPKTIDEIIRGTTLSSQKVSEQLLLLELEGLVESLPGKQYKKRSNIGQRSNAKTL